MELLLCCLIHLHLIFSPGTYSLAELNLLESENQIEIDLIRTDPSVSRQVYDEHSTELQFINIFDDSEM